MSQNKKKFYGWQWTGRPMSDGTTQIVLFLPQGAYLNPTNDTPYMVRYLSFYGYLASEIQEMRDEMEAAL